MRVAVFFNNPCGGVGRVVYEQARRLAARFDVQLFTLSPPGRGLQKLEMLRPTRPITYKGFSSIPRPFGRLSSVTSLYELRLLASAYRAVGEHISKRFDVVLVHPCPYTSAPLLLRYLQIPSLLYIGEPLRGFYEPRVERPQTGLRLAGRYSEQLDRLDPLRYLSLHVHKHTDRFNARCASSILTYTYYSRESLYRAYGVNARVNYLGVDATVFRPLPVESEHLVLSLGHVHPLKGHDFVIESVGRLPKAERPRLLVAGDMSSDTERSYLSTLAKGKGVDLEFDSSNDEEHIVRRYNRAKVLAFAPILEPFGLAPLESMACGVPAIGVREAGIRETIRDGEGGYLTDRDPEDFAARLSQLLTDDELRREQGRLGREYVAREWNWDRSIGGLKAALERVEGTQ